MKVVFQGANAAVFREGFEEVCAVEVEIVTLPDGATEGFEDAEVIVATRWAHDGRDLGALRLFQIPAAGTEGIDRSLLPPTAAICNCYGHEVSIAEYVMLASLRHIHPVEHADAQLRKGVWTWCAQVAGEMHEEFSGHTIGLLGFGHIGREVARKAKAFDLRVVAANRTPLEPSPLVDLALTLDERDRLYAECDVIVCTLPHLPELERFVDAAAFAAMRPSALFVNVGRGPVVDERALYDALAGRRIGGAAIDTWWIYPSGGQQETLPASLPFHELDNLLMTPHLSGWTHGTRRRRRAAIADNVARLARGQPLVNLVRAARA